MNNNIRLNDLLKRVDGGDNTEKLAALVIQLNNTVKDEKRKRLLTEIGSEKLFDDIDFYNNKVIYRNRQVKNMYKMSKSIVILSTKIIKTIPRKQKRKLEAAIRYLKRMRKYLHVLRYEVNTIKD